MMKTERLTGFGLLLLGIGVAANAFLGPLLLGVIRSHVSHAMENQQIGGEIISLFVAAPVAVVAGTLWLRGHRLAPLLAIAPALYAIYTYVTFVVVVMLVRNDPSASPAMLVITVVITVALGLVTLRLLTNAQHATDSGPVEASPVLHTARHQPPVLRLRGL
jgi:hypothetical protein